ncbi:unnamed protein product (macronuclear) [Paramecium tetraurelia]|uniref:Glycoside hydrolase family 5 domain-containing protein n=1 Tax=Paramecium tetraurelia TaxID=5888 RepID=A0BWA3_PARTE|nr:uncharacterized protein GSPATT00032672001 [Paramecium tetraurelia]CAK62820.1 unnamed protein product [Paramecium tetraurelia]|eukprot:XP_001430218.1 hypothetical protein (macronuclear) [Paramecium tetraurelia strain d4-2]
MKYCILLFYLVFVSSSFSVNTNDQFIVDSDGLRRVFHGVNVVYKLPPFYPPVSEGFDPNDSLSDFDLDNLISWGMTFIRLHVAWEGVEPVRGQYNYTYLEEIDKIVKRCEAKGITVLLDSHQDVLNRFFCGNGFPDWTIARTKAKAFKFPYPYVFSKIHTDEEGVPIIEDCLKKKFALYYVTAEASKTFQNLFDNKDGIADSFAEYWGVVANYFKDHKNVIGYEIINEPIQGSIYHSIREFLFPNYGNNHNLLPLYRKVHKEIRKFDDKKIIFFEPGTTDLIGAGFKDTPGGEEYNDREVYSYHIYCFNVDDYSIPKNEKVCNYMDSFFFATKEGVAKHLGVGKFLTEFGAILDTPKGNKELDYLLDLMESKFTSWAYWEFKYYADVTTQAHPGQIESFYDEFGQLYTNKVKTLSRPYVTKICGSPNSSTFNVVDENSHFLDLDWSVSKKCNGKQTELFLSREFYFDEVYVHFENCAGCTLEAISKSYYVVVLPDNIKERTTISLTVTNYE